jgi:hypothetical protein
MGLLEGKDETGSRIVKKIGKRRFNVNELNGTILSRSWDEISDERDRWRNFPPAIVGVTTAGSQGNLSPQQAPNHPSTFPPLDFSLLCASLLHCCTFQFKDEFPGSIPGSKTPLHGVVEYKPSFGVV